MTLEPKQQISVFKRRERKLLRKLGQSQSNEIDSPDKLRIEAKRMRKNLREARFSS